MAHIKRIKNKDKQKNPRDMVECSYCGEPIKYVYDPSKRDTCLRCDKILNQKK